MKGFFFDKMLAPTKGGGNPWPSYWATHLFGEADINMRLDSRSGLTLVDSVGSADASILPSYCSIAVGDTGITPDANTIVACKFKLGSYDVILGSQTVGAMFRFAKAGANWMLSWGNVEYGLSAGGVDANWHTLIVYNKRAWVLAPTVELTDASILNVISTVTPTINNTTATWGTATSSINLNRLGALAVYGDSAFAEFFVGNLVDSIITWQRKYVIPQPVFLSVTTYTQYIFDTLVSPTHMSCQSRVTNCVVAYDASASTYPLLNGYSLYRREGSADIHLPYKVDGTPNTPPAALATNGYVWISDHPTNAMHNLASCKIRFATGSIFDRSSTDVWEDAARSASDYDAANPTDFEIKNLNRFILSDWLKTGYDGRIFAHVDDNSLLEEDRDNLVEIFTYPTEVTGDDFNKVLQFCGDYTGYVTEVWLRDPYNEVYKITAVGDAEFRFNINDAIVYTKSSLASIIDSVEKQTPNEDDLTTFLRFMYGVGRGVSNHALEGEAQRNPLNFINSYPWGVCSEVAMFAYQNLKDEYAIRFGVKPGHTMNYITDGPFLDYRLHCLVYKEPYVHADFSEIMADLLWFNEPIRKTTPASDWYTANLYTGLYHFWEIVDNPTFLLESTQDNFVMKMPNTASFVFPVKSTNVPLRYDGVTNINYYGSGIMTIPSGITGAVEMPFTLLQITGTGSVTVAGVTYDLPGDEAALKAVLQAYEDLYRTFTIVTNTGGLSAEYFVNHRRLFLYNKNTLTKGIISGDITIDREKTTIPLTTFPLSVNKGTSTRWTILFDKYFTVNKTFKHPVTNTDDDTHDRPRVHFLGGTTNPRPIEYYKATNALVAINAGTAVTDQCFAAVLTPRNTAFTTTLELTFTSVDGSSTYYTLDGSTPSASKTLYTAPFTISATTTVKWINIRAGYADSHVNTRVITKTA